MVRKGITPIISVVLLLMMTVGAFGLAYVWLKNFQSGVQEEMSRSAQEVISEIQRSVKIIAIYKDTSTSQTKISIQNNGKMTIRDDEFKSMIIKLDGKVIPNNIVSIPNGDLPPNDMKVITLNKDYFSGSSSPNVVDGSVHVWEIIMGSMTSTYSCGPLDTTDEAC